MASLLRQIVAGPRARHPEAGLDLCYVTDHIIATSGPSSTYPQRAYRNPLDSLVKFLDSKHGNDWAIWEFRAEGTGYPDSEVYNRVYHYPFPDHHPPPFALIPHIMASMRNWLKEKQGRVVVVHCKAGKGRSGTASCSYLISEEGWKVEDALKRFTERRMRPGLGPGVSIPSQLRWINYVDRWAKHGKIYVERQVEVLEVHCWGLTDGVKIQIEGFVNDGKVIKSFHSFTRSEREVVRGAIPVGSLAEAVTEIMSTKGLGRTKSKRDTKAPEGHGEQKQIKQSADESSRGIADSADGANSSRDDSNGASKETPKEEKPTIQSGKGDVIFRPSKRLVLTTNDINIDVERRNKAAYGLTMVTSVAHVWFNTFFEGNGPEQKGQADESGVFEIEWDDMDGIKGSKRKGTRAFDKVALVWKALKDPTGNPGVVITEPKEGEEVKQTSPADWQGENHVTPGDGKDLGLRKSSPDASSADLSKASSIKSQKGQSAIITAPDPHENTLHGVRTHGPNGEEVIEHPESGSAGEQSAGGRAEDALAPSDTHAQVDGGSSLVGRSEQSAESPAVPRVESPDQTTGRTLVQGIQHVSSGDVPDGKPEDELKTASEHSLGHIKYKKNTSTSS